MEYPLNYDSPAELRDYLESCGLSMKKRFGQNFLINRGAREKIISSLPLKEGDSLWEIGPGLGAMTWHLLEKKAAVTVFEIDHGFIRSLKSFYDENPSFRLIEGDFLKNFKAICSGGLSTVAVPDYILGNLPYVSGSVMIAEIIKSGISPSCMVFTLQKEVGRRMAASPGTKDFSSFSLICQSRYDIRLNGEISPGSFYPSPSVQSIIVECRLKNQEEIPALYYELVDDLFLARRKTIANNVQRGRLAARYGKDVLLNALTGSGIEGSRRSETLSVAEVSNISRHIQQYIK